LFATLPNFSTVGKVLRLLNILSIHGLRLCRSVFAKLPHSLK
jgi:hypothetical protein